MAYDPYNPHGYDRFPEDWDDCRDCGHPRRSGHADGCAGELRADIGRLRDRVGGGNEVDIDDLRSAVDGTLELMERLAAAVGQIRADKQLRDEQRMMDTWPTT